MFGKLRRGFGRTKHDLKREHDFRNLRQEILTVIFSATGREIHRWKGPGSEVHDSAIIDPDPLIPLAKKIITSKLAGDADTDEHVRRELVGAVALDEISVDDINIYLKVVVGAIEARLGRPSRSIRLMASVAGGYAHEMNVGQIHVMNGHWADAESEFRLALEMCELSPDGRRVVTMFKIGDMVRLQNRNDEAIGIFRDASQFLDKLDSSDEFYEIAVNTREKVRSQIEID